MTTPRQRQRTYRAALIGCGRMGRSHALALASAPDIALTALADVEPTGMDRLGDEFGVPPRHRHPGVEALLDAEELDFVVVATQAPQHAAATIAAARHGVHVLCEKPLALDLAEADAMVAACAQAGVRLAVNHLRRADPAARLARDLIAAGEIGEIVAVDIHDKGGRPVGNTLMEMGTHYVDLARFLLSGRRLADGRRADDLEWVLARLSTGLRADAHPATTAEIMPSQMAMPTDRDCGLVLGERGTVVFGLAGEVHAVARFHHRRKADTLYDGVDVIGTAGSLAVRGGTANRLYRRQGHTFAEHDPWRPAPLPAAAEVEDFNRVGVPRCRAMAQELAAAIDEDREHASSGRDGLIALEAVLAVYESHRHGRPVALPLGDRRHPLTAWSAGGRASVPVGAVPEARPASGG